MAGACCGALFFGHLRDRFGRKQLAFCIGAAVMCAAGLVEAAIGVRAERRSLESLAAPLSAVPAATGPETTP